MIEITIKNYLEENLNKIPVVLEYPKNPPKKFVMLQLADAGCINHIDAATFFITINAPSLYEAAELREQVKDILFNAVSLECISSATLGSDRADIDSANHVYQYDLTFNFYYYREET